MRRRHTVPILLLLVALLPTAAASGAACSPLQCGPAATTVANGKLLALRTNGGSTGVYDLTSGKIRDTLAGAFVTAGGRYALGQEGRLLRKYEFVSGRVIARARLAPGWNLAGASADGRQTVLFKVVGATTRVAIRGLRPQSFVLRGRYGFEGLRAGRLYLIQYVSNGYLVRAADLATGKLLPRALKGADEPALIQGQAWSQVASRDGRYLFTLYITAQSQPMVHMLDMGAGKARCIPLPGASDYAAAGSYSLALSQDGRRLYAAGSAHGAVVTIDVARRAVSRVGHVAPQPAGNPVLPSASLSPDGKTLAFATNRTAWLYDLRRGKLLRKTQLPVVGVVAYSPTGRLWVAGRDGVLQSALT